jgi:hypothetical protein
MLCKKVDGVEKLFVNNKSIEVSTGLVFDDAGSVTDINMRDEFKNAITEIIAYYEKQAGAN